MHLPFTARWMNAAGLGGLGIVVLAVSTVCGSAAGAMSGLSFQQFSSPLFGVVPVIGFLSIAAWGGVAFWVFNPGFCRLIPAASELKGGRWTKDQCGGVQGWRAGLSGLAWADRRRSE